MKKSIIAAGAASMALAAMPVVGVFATTQINGSPIVDTLSVSIGDACTFSRKVTTSGEEPDVVSDNGHPAGTSTATGASWSHATYTSATTVNEREIAAGTDHDTFTATVIAGNTYDAIAKSAFQVVCNDATGGYKVTAYPAALAGTSTNIAYNQGTSYAGSGSSWYLTSSAATVSGATPVVWSHTAYDGTSGTSKLSSADFTITYNLNVALDQAVDTYTGDIVYELATL